MPAIFINETGTLGQIVYSVTQNVTGDLYLTLFLVVIVLFVVAMIFRLPVELFAIFMVPMLLILMAYQGTPFLIIGGLFMLYLAVMAAKYWFIK